MEVFTSVGGCLRYWHLRRRWRPGGWTVTARSRDEVFAGEPTGWRASGELLVRVRAEIEQTGRPGSLRAVETAVGRPTPPLPG